MTRPQTRSYDGWHYTPPPEPPDSCPDCSEDWHDGIACDAIPDAREDQGHGFRDEDAA